MSAQLRPRTALVHLVRAANGEAPFDAFMTSYERLDAGHEHELVLLLKGFGAPDLLQAIRRRAAAHAPSEIRVGDEGLDIEAYLKAAGCLPHEQVCLLNSFSEPLVDGWLGALAEPLADHRTGATAATGSWGSILGFGLWQAGLGGSYDCVFGDRRQTRDVWHAANGLGRPNDRSYRVRNAIDVLRTLGVGSLFPAVHLRTNAFCIRRQTLQGLAISAARTRRANYGLESGRDSITRRLQARDLGTLVVGRSGVPLEPSRWPEAAVFWQDEQQDLLVGDNQTRLYDAATPAQRAALRGYAWGLHARPSARSDG